MRRDALRLARQFLREPRVKASEFNAALDAILIHAETIRSWKPLVEEAYHLLPRSRKRAVRYQMLAFYYSLREWQTAQRFVSSRAQSGSDLLFSMETLLNLKNVEAAKPIQRKCKKILDNELISTTTAGPLLAALAAYHSQVGELAAARGYYEELSKIEPYVLNGFAGLIELAVVRGMLYVTEGMKQIEELRKSGVDEEAIILPRNRDAILAQARRRLNRYQGLLEKIVPPDNLWTFGF
jgi:tetratricopeptide (TPR) repeat protein